jgi:hypothetical protein
MDRKLPKSMASINDTAPFYVTSDSPLDTYQTLHLVFVKLGVEDIVPTPKGLYHQTAVAGTGHRGVTSSALLLGFKLIPLGSHRTLNGCDNPSSFTVAQGSTPTSGMPDSR